jgi:TetR/AcrR family transcriptional regulator, ethionamide resistance regulator
VGSVTRAGVRSTRAENRVRVRRELLVGVERLLAEGERYSDISVERLVKASGISRSTFYYHFDGKSDLLQALVEDAIGAIIDSAEYWWSMGPASTKADLREGLRRVLVAYRPHRLLWVATVEAAAYDDGVRDRFEAMMAQGQAQIEKHIRRGQAEGFIDPNAAAEVVASWLTWMSERGIYQMVSRTDDAAELELLLDGIVEVYWRVLYEPAPVRARASAGVAKTRRRPSSAPRKGTRAS